MHVSILDHVEHFKFVLSRSLKVKCDNVIGLPIFGFVVVYSGKIWPNSALQDISFLSDIDSDLSR